MYSVGMTKMSSELCTTCQKPRRMSEKLLEHFERLRSVSPRRMVQDGGRFHDDPLHIDPIDDMEIRFRFETGLCVCDWD